MRALRPVPAAGTGPPPTTPCGLCEIHHDGPVGECEECRAGREMVTELDEDELVLAIRDLQERALFAEARLAAKEVGR